MSFKEKLSKAALKKRNVRIYTYGNPDICTFVGTIVSVDENSINFREAIGGDDDSEYYNVEIPINAITALRNEEKSKIEK